MKLKSGHLLQTVIFIYNGKKYRFDMDSFTKKCEIYMYISGFLSEFHIDLLIGEEVLHYPDNAMVFTLFHAMSDHIDRNIDEIAQEMNSSLDVNNESFINGKQDGMDNIFPEWLRSI